MATFKLTADRTEVVVELEAGRSRTAKNLDAATRVLDEAVAASLDIEPEAVTAEHRLQFLRERGGCWPKP